MRTDDRYGYISAISANNSLLFSGKDYYQRPQRVSSYWIEVHPSEELNISTPYGGAIYVQWSAQTEDTKPTVNLTFENILLHPVLNLDGSETQAQKAQEIATFSNALQQSDNFSWVDIKTPFAEIHSLTRNLMGVINNQTYNGDIAKYINYLNRYLILGNYHWAGFNGGGLEPLNPSVVSFCNEKQLNCTDPVIHQKPVIQHMNSDAKAICGNACAGNPIDFDHGIDPIAQLPNHEMGHNLQKHRIGVPNGGEISNLISVFYTMRTFALDHNKTNFNGWGQIRVNFKSVFERLKTLNTNGSLPVTNKSPLYGDHFSGVAFYEQLLWSSSDDENVSWDFYTKMWIHDRLYGDAISKDEAYWNSKRDSLGFSTYSLDEAKIVNGPMGSNPIGYDYLAIVSSFITDKDYSDFFEMWKLKVSDKAKTQITANNIVNMQPREFLHILQDPNGEYNVFRMPVHAPSTWIDMSNITSTMPYAAP